MQNSKNAKRTAFISAADIRKPNILRRKPCFRPSNPISDSDKLQSLPKSLHMPELAVVNANVDGLKRETGNRDGPRVRKPSQKIILDTYMCNKRRTSSDNNSNCDAVDTFVAPSIESKNLNLPIVEEVDDMLKSVINDILSNENDETLVGADLLADELFNSENDVNMLNGLSRDQVLAALEADNFSVGQLLLGEGAEQEQYWFCPILNCNKLYNEKSDLYIHILTHYDLESYKCEFSGCLQEFVSENLLKQHCEIIHGQKETPKVDKLSQIVSSIIPFEDGDTEEPRHVIDAALASVGITEKQILSVQQPDGGRRWLCPQNDCNLLFKAPNVLKNHILMHYDLRPFKCKHEGCSWAFRFLHKLKKHLNVHKVHDRTSHMCTYPGCQKTFSTKYNLSAHLKTHDKQEEIACPARDCTLTFPLRASVEAHLEEDHTIQQAMHSCGSCGKRFWWSIGMTIHARVHVDAPGEPICPWPDCGRRFTLPSQLRYHIRSHTGDKPYCCTYPSCNWAFSSSSKLARHARAHSSNTERRYVCAVCKSAFLRPEHLKEHLPRHMQQRNHQCDYPGCEQKFSNKSSVYVHKKREHGISSRNKTEQIKAIENIPILGDSSIDFISMGVCDDDLLSLRSARTHVPWFPDISRDLLTPILPQNSGLLPHQQSCEGKQGNPLVCGGLSLEGDGSAVGVGLIMDVEESTVSSLPELESDLLESSGDLLLLQEELSDGMLYTAEEDATLQVLLLNEDPTQ